MAERQCPVCMEPYTDAGDKVPKLLPCSHTVCAQCLNGLHRYEPNFGDHVVCPECRERHEICYISYRGVGASETFPTNRYIVEAQKALMEKDQEIQKIVSSKDKEIQKIVSSKDKEIEEVQTALASKEDEIEILKAEAELLMCPDHVKPCVVFCSNLSCLKMLCTSCPLVEHVKHDLTGLEECLSSTQKGIKVCKEAESKLNGLLKDLSDAEEAAEEAHKITSEKITEELEVAIERAEALTQTSAENLEKQRKEIEEIREKVKKVIEEGEEIKKVYQAEPVKKTREKLVELADQLKMYQTHATEVENAVFQTQALTFERRRASHVPLGDLVCVAAPASKVPFPELPKPEVPKPKTARQEVPAPEADHDDNVKWDEEDREEEDLDGNALNGVDSGGATRGRDRKKLRVVSKRLFRLFKKKGKW